MASHRPGFARHDTDGIDNNPLNYLRNDSKGNVYNSHRDIEMEGYGASSKHGDDGIHYTGSDSASFDAAKEDHFGEAIVVTDAKDLLTHVIHVDDDSSLSPWTFRTAFLGNKSIGFRICTIS